MTDMPQAPRLTFRILQPEDVEMVFKVIQAYPEMAETMTWNVPQNLEEARTKLFTTREPEDRNWGLFLGEEFVGRLTVRNFRYQQQDARKDSAFLSFWISPKFQGQGFGTEALRAVCVHGFKNFALRKFFAGFFDGNIASQKLLEKVGFRKVGILRKHYLKNGEYYDSVRYELLEEDFINAD